MKEFIEKLVHHKYISLSLYNEVMKTNPKAIPKEFSLDDYNEKVLNEGVIKYQSYFKDLYKGIDDNIVLDDEQIKVILSDEDYALVLAGAGTGKTTTIAAKVKYLVDILKVDPKKILVMSYTKKATEELERRIVIDFNIPAVVTTFHSLGLMHIREIFHNHKCLVVDDNLKDEIFYEYFKEKIFKDKKSVKEITEIFKNVNDNNTLLSRHFLLNYAKYATYDEYLEKYKEDMLKEVKDVKEVIQRKIDKLLNLDDPITIKNELVKSKGEALIANYLFMNGIDYQYEKVYKELMEDKRVLKPDFTLELAGEEIYIEYFGLSNYKKDELARYDKIRKMKEDYHLKHHNKFIKLDYVPNENMLEKLENELKNLGFTFKPKTDKEIFFKLLDANPLSQIYGLKNYFYKIIDTIKSSSKRMYYQGVVKDYLDKLDDDDKRLKTRQFYYLNDFYLYYQKKLYGSFEYYFDFSDMIYYANLYIDLVGRNNNLEFSHIIIDEYQDISEERYEFARSIANRSGAKVMAYGDDWQAIYSFAGSKIKYIYEFKSYFNNAKIFNITHTYRNSQKLINYSGKFIMKNKKQINKNLVSDKENKRPIRFVTFTSGTEYETLKKLLLAIHKSNPDHNVLILARNNQMIERCYDDPLFKDEIGTKIEFVGYEDMQIDGMTIHKSKGLTKDEVIVIGLNEFFPHGNYSEFWLEALFKESPLAEPIAYAEERRLFYVALTRTKNNVYLLVNEDAKHRSPFINQLCDIIKEVDASSKEQV